VINPIKPNIGLWISSEPSPESSVGGFTFVQGCLTF